MALRKWSKIIIAIFIVAVVIAVGLHFAVKSTPLNKKFDTTTVVFNENGLPQNYTWKVAVGSKTFTSNQTNITFQGLKVGSYYNFAVYSVRGYVPYHPYNSSSIFPGDFFPSSFKPYPTYYDSNYEIPVNHSKMSSLTNEVLTFEINFSAQINVTSWNYRVLLNNTLYNVVGFTYGPQGDMYYPSDTTSFGFYNNVDNDSATQITPVNGSYPAVSLNGSYNVTEISLTTNPTSDIHISKLLPSLPMHYPYTGPHSWYNWFTITINIPNNVPMNVSLTFTFTISDWNPDDTS